MNKRMHIHHQWARRLRFALNLWLALALLAGPMLPGSLFCLPGAAAEESFPLAEGLPPAPEATLPPPAASAPPAIGKVPAQPTEAAAPPAAASTEAPAPGQDGEGVDANAAEGLPPAQGEQDTSAPAGEADTEEALPLSPEGEEEPGQDTTQDVLPTETQEPLPEEPAAEITPANLAEHPAFTCGYGVLLADGALYSQISPGDTRRTLLTLRAGETVYVNGLAEHALGDTVEIWANLSLRDGEGKAVEGWMEASRLMALEGEAAQGLSGLPQVSGLRIQPKEAPTAEPPQQQEAPPQPETDILLMVSLKEGMVTLTAGISGLPQEVPYTLQWQNDLSGELADVPGATGQSHTFPATEENMNCGWRVAVHVRHAEPPAQEDMLQP